jgi:hypothetical protein
MRVRCVVFILASLSSVARLGEVGAVALREAVRGVVLRCVCWCVGSMCTVMLILTCLTASLDVLCLCVCSCSCVAAKKKLACASTLVRKKKRLRTSVSCV